MNICWPNISINNLSQGKLTASSLHFIRSQYLMNNLLRKCISQHKKVCQFNKVLRDLSVFSVVVSTPLKTDKSRKKEKKNAHQMLLQVPLVEKVSTLLGNRFFLLLFWAIQHLVRYINITCVWWVLLKLNFST